MTLRHPYGGSGADMPIRSAKWVYSVKHHITNTELTEFRVFELPLAPGTPKSRYQLASLGGAGRSSLFLRQISSEPKSTIGQK